METIDKAEKGGKSREEILAWLKIACVFGGNVRAVTALIRSFGTPEDVFDAPKRLLAKVIGMDDAAALLSVQTEETAQKSFNWLESAPSADIVVLTDDDYPQALIHAGEPPALLFIRGQRALLRKERVLLAVTAAADKEGQENAADFAAALSASGVVPVSFLETAAEKVLVSAAARPGLGIIVCSAGGPDRVSAQRLRVYEAVESNGLIVTAEFPGTGATDVSRGRCRWLAAALSRALLVIQAERRSTILGLAREAGNLGRDVAALPGSVHSPLYKGNHQLIREGARLVENIDDLKADLRLD